MKKHLIFALAALALAFTACDPNNPSNPGEYYAKDYVGTQWITDSTFIEGEGLSPAPHAYINVLSETEAEINGWPTNYKIEGNILYLHTEVENPTPLNIINADKDHANLLWKGFNGDGSDGLIHMTRVEEPQGPDLDVNVANITGKWRLMYSKSIETDFTNHEPDYKPYVIIHGMPGEEIYDFKADGSIVNTNSFDRLYDAEPRTGWWQVRGNQLVYATGTTEYPAASPDEITDEWWLTVTKLTGNVMKTYKTETFMNYNMEYIDYYVRVK